MSYLSLTISAWERPQTHTLDRAATGPAHQSAGKTNLHSVILVTNEAGLIVNEGIMNVNIHHSWAWNDIVAI
jgi:hypothetical protein